MSFHQKEICNFTMAKRMTYGSPKTFEATDESWR